jgi:serine/threonine protein kinase
MSLVVGDKLGPYEIQALIGKGGMGEVYRARDPRVGRDVAIKVASVQFTERFDREVRAVAALNHPNICTLYDVGPNYLVMEYVEGEAPKGPLPLEDALRIARQIGAALECAHERGIVHRDLKPANIKVKPDETVKVLDFGLAKVTSASSAETPENSPTLSMAATQMGVVLGTAGYMAPEQARGKAVDKRADIWAFGVVLHELLTGQRLFQGEDLTETLASVVKEKPDLSQAPAGVRRLLQSCLEKDPKNRLRDIGDAWRLLEDQPAPASVPARSRASAILPWGAAAVLATGLAFFAYRYLTQEPPRMVRFSVQPPPNARFLPTPPSVSPDGRKIAVGVVSEGKTEIWIRDLDSLAARPLPGTEAPAWPAWSPDSRSVAFWSDGKLKRIDIGGGPAVAIADTNTWNGGSWSRNDVIVFARQDGLYRLAAGGGTATPVTALDKASSEIFHGAPAFMPDGRHFLYGAVSLDREKTLVYAGDIESKEPAKNRRRVPANLGKPVYAGGYLLFTRENTLMAQPFDPKRLEATGVAVPVAEKVADFSGLGMFDASQDVLAYISGPSAADVQLTWYDRAGKLTGRMSQPGLVEWVSISPDGSTAAFTRNEDVTRFDIWLHDLARDTDSRFTFGTSSGFPVWSPDGQRVAYTSIRAGTANTYVKAIGGASKEEALDTSARNKRVDDWSKDGRYILEGYYDDPKTKADLWALPMSGDRKPVPYLNSEFTERYGRFSPDGQWVAYMSDENGRDEIFVQQFPTPGGKKQISTHGGAYPTWSRDGNELFFIAPDGKMMGVAVKGGDRFTAGTPKPLFDAHLVTFGQETQFNVSKDGRFLIPSQAEPGAALPMTVVLNWRLGLKK